MDVESFIKRLDMVRQDGSGARQWTARCPAHDDRKPSLSISEGEDGRILLKCHAGCSTEQIVGAIGLTLGDLFRRGRSKMGRHAGS